MHIELPETQIAFDYTQAQVGIRKRRSQSDRTKWCHSPTQSSEIESKHVAIQCYLVKISDGQHKLSRHPHATNFS